MVSWWWANGGNVQAQAWLLTNGRLPSMDGKWLAPLASTTLSSSEEDHLARGSVFAWDISAPFGTPVFPMAAGEVIYSGCNNAGGYGCWALIDHKDGYTSLYGHMIDEGGGRIWVAPGEKVSVWTPLGRVGWTGMTSFGPHIHWEIHHKTEGRVRIDRYFRRFNMVYCKFCSASEEGQQGGLGYVFQSQAAPYYANLLSTQFLLILLLLLLLVAGMARPVASARLARRLGGWAWRLGRSANQGVDSVRRSRVGPAASILLMIFVPSLLCGGALGVSVWMADEGVTPQQIYYFVRYGFYPNPGHGYQPGRMYSAVWGTPCQNNGSLGVACSIDELIAIGESWQREVALFTGKSPTFVLIPRLNTLFGYTQSRFLIREAHNAGGLVIVDVEGDLGRVYDVIDRLTPFGLDGVAIDLEFTENVGTSDLQRLAVHLAESRKEAKLAGDGILVVWDVFHNIRIDGPLSVEGVQIIPIFTGYGSATTKIAGLTATQKLFNAEPENSGLMTFDGRWPVNPTCGTLDKRLGYDCQRWDALFTMPTARDVGWWVQQ